MLVEFCLEVVSSPLPDPKSRLRGLKPPTQGIGGGLRLSSELGLGLVLDVVGVEARSRTRLGRAQKGLIGTDLKSCGSQSPAYVVLGPLSQARNSLLQLFALQFPGLLCPHSFSVLQLPLPARASLLGLLTNFNTP